MRRLFLVALFCAIPLLAHAQPAHDGEANCQVQSSVGGTPFNICTNKTTAGSNRIGIVTCVTSATPGAMSATWNAVDMGTEWVTAVNGTDGRTSRIWKIVNPPTGSSSVAVQSANAVSKVCRAASYNNAHQTTQDGATNSASGTADPASVTCATSATELVLDSLYFIGGGTPPAVGSSQTSTGSLDDGSWFHTSSYQNGSVDGVMTWSLTTPTRWTSVCASLKVAAAAAGKKRSMLLRGELFR